MHTSINTHEAADSTKVICPECTHKFRAIPPQVQELMLTAGFEPPFDSQPDRFDYIGQAQQTKSDKFFGEKVPYATFLETLRNCALLLAELGIIKKTLFYGEPLPPDMPMLKLGDVNSNAALMTWNTKDGAVVPISVRVDIVHSIIGKMTEAGELAELLLKTIDTGVFDRVNFQEEIGDGQWYDAIGVAAVSRIPPSYIIDVDGQYPFEALQRQNIAKLRERFGDKFTAYDAVNRRLDEERRTLQEHEMHGQEPLSGVHVVGSTEFVKALDKSEPAA